jgi:riboflavin synthase
MFTGLVQELGRVTAVERTPDGARLTISGRLSGELGEGDSVAVNGVCLTATAVHDGTFEADVMDETLRRCTLGAAQEGSAVNLELPLRASDRMGGHFVQGHVDGTGTVAEVREEGFSRVARISTDPRLLRYVAEKGSVAVDGISLTVSSVDAGSLTVSLIPETLRRTSLGAAQPGDAVNLEVDLLAKYVERLVSS